MNSIIEVTREIVQNRSRMIRMAVYELIRQNRGTFLGFLWNFANPALQILVYWFVFSIGLSASTPRDEYPYIVWMIVGVIPWFYISAALQVSANSILNSAGIIKRMFIPLSIIPLKTVFAQFFSHCLSMVIVFIIYIGVGGKLTFSTLWLLYYMFATIVFLIGFSLLFSSLTVLVRDISKLLPVVIRLLFYLSPVVWSQENLPETFQTILKLNPFAYIINGYRNSILYGEGFVADWKYGIYFWVVTILLFVIGCRTHMKFRKQFIDLI